MILRIAFIILIALSITGLYLYENTLSYLLENNQEGLNLSLLSITLILSIIFITGVTGFLFSLLRNDDKFKNTTIIKRPDSGKESEIPSLSEDVVMLLSLLQEEGRLLDFLSEDITSYDDSQVASAGRIVHRGCSTVLKKYFELSPILDSENNSSIEKPQNIPTTHLKIHGKPTNKIKIIHKGWQLNSANLPKKISDNKSKNKVITPAEADSIE